MEVNARIQLEALRLGGAVRCLDPDEARLAARTVGAFERAWEVWKREATPVRGAVDS